MVRVSLYFRLIVLSSMFVASNAVVAGHLNVERLVV